MSRYHQSEPCPVCGGWSTLRRGAGVRCAGYRLDAVAYCTREQFAGRLALQDELSPPAYKHRLSRTCECGLIHLAGDRPTGPVFQSSKPSNTLSIEVRDAIYSRLLELLQLRDSAATNLLRRGLTFDAVERWGFRSLPRRGREHIEVRDRLVNEFGPDVLRRCPGTHNKNGVIGTTTSSAAQDGFYVPFRDEKSRITGMQIRWLDGRGYQTLFGSRVEDLYLVAGEHRAGQDLVVTEGGLKAFVASSHDPNRTYFGVPGQTLKPSHLDAIGRLAQAGVIVALDREANETTTKMRQKWIGLCLDAGLPTFEAVWEQER